MEDPDKSESVITPAPVDTAKSIDPDVRVAKQILASEVLCVLAMLFIWASINPDHTHIALIGGLVVLVPHGACFRWMLKARSPGATAFFAMLRSLAVIGALIVAVLTFPQQLVPLLTTAATVFLIPICVSMLALAKPRTSQATDLRTVLQGHSVNQQEAS